MRLRQATMMSLKWIAQRLKMGTWAYKSNSAAAQEMEGQSVNSYDRPLLIPDTNMKIYGYLHIKRIGIAQPP